MKKLLLALTAVMLAFAVLVSCSSSNDSEKNESYSELTNGATGMEGVLFDKYDIGVTEDSTNSQSGTGKPITDDRKIIKNAQMHVETKTFDSFISVLETDIAELKGYIEQKEISKNSKDHRNAYIVIRIPAENLNKFMGKVSENGNVTYENESAVDVTSSYNDTERHIKSLETEQERLLEIMKKADTLTDILSIEERLTQIRYELDGYEQTLSSYDEQIEYSTITLSVSEVEVVTVGDDEGFFNQVAEGFMGSLKAIGTIFRTLALVILSGSPFIILIGVFIAAVIIVIKFVNKKRKNK